MFFNFLGKGTMVFLFLFLFLSIACNNKNALGIDDQADTTVVENIYIDSLKLIQGKIPEGWTKLEIIDGYYTAFPKPPSNKDLLFGHFLKYQLRQKEYLLYFSKRDLEKEGSFDANRENKAAYYQAIINDLVEDLVTPEIETKIEYIQPFMALEIHQGIEAIITTNEDIHIFTRIVIIDNNMFTSCFIAWVPPTKENLQIKDQFLYAFGKDLYIK